MRKMLMIGTLSGMLLATFPAQAQMQELQQLALNIEKLSQFRSILKDMKKGYELLTNGYNTVKDLTEGNFTLHETFLDALLQVSPTVRNYKRVGDIIDSQIILVEEYNRSRQRFLSSGLYSVKELSYFESTYDKLFNESLQHLDELTMVLTAGVARMSDNERLEMIDSIYTGMQDKLLFVKEFNNDAAVLGLQRAKERHDVEAMRILSGIN